MRRAAAGLDGQACVVVEVRQLSEPLIKRHTKVGEAVACVAALVRNALPCQANFPATPSASRSTNSSSTKKHIRGGLNEQLAEQRAELKDERLGKGLAKQLAGVAS